MTLVVRLRSAGPATAELLDWKELQENAPRPFGFRPRPPAIPSSVHVAPDEANGLRPEEVRRRLGEMAASLVRPHYPNAHPITLEWQGAAE